MPTKKSPITEVVAAKTTLSSAQKSQLVKQLGASFVSAFGGFGTPLPANSKFEVVVSYGTTWDSIVAKQKSSDTDDKFHRFCPVSCTLLNEDGTKSKDVYPSSLYCGNPKLEDDAIHPLEEMFDEFGENIELLYDMKFIGRTSDEVEKTSKDGETTYKVTYLSLVGTIS